MTSTSDAMLGLIFGPAIVLFAVFSLFVAHQRSRESEGEYSASIFIVPALLQIAIGIFMFYEAVHA